MDKPAIKEKVSLEDVKKQTEDYLEWLASEDYCEDEIENYERSIYELVMTALYGREVWDFINSKID